jgi:tetratricopeptide (TPR) repeat protein
VVSRFVLVGLLLLLGACASGPQPAPPAEVEKHEPSPVKPSPGTQGATSGLLEEARTARELGEYDRAAGLLQRAQRIDSRNALIYLELARLYLEQGEAEEARAVAERGLSYCTGATCNQLRQIL